MRIAFFSDTHGNLKEFFNKIDFTGVELIVFLGDNETKDLELFKNINIKKIGFLGNHMPWEKTNDKINIFDKFGVEDISWKKFYFLGKTFFGIPGEMKYMLCESIINGQPTFPIFRDTYKDIEEFKNKVKTLSEEKVDIVLSHFPVFGIMDRPKDLSHRGLKFLKEYIEENNPEYIIHGHMHDDDSRIFNNTKIQQVFMYKISDM